MDKIMSLVEYITNLMQQMGVFAGIIPIILESVIPMLPLSVFVALNVNAFGLVLGFIISWISTCIGCYISYSIFKLFSGKIENRFGKNKKTEKIIISIRKMELSNLVVILALPFTPAFAINIGAGIVNMSKKKFMVAILIGKFFMIGFWSFIGKSILQSVTDINTLIVIIIALIAAYLLSKFISKNANIE